jgi:KDO2-lipid IV(A) lauroyltransferase
LAEFILGNPLRKLARDNHTLRRLLWRLDFVFVWVLVKLFAALPLDVASRFGDRVGRFIGPRLTRKSALFRANMAQAFPELDEAGLDRLVRRAWGRAGRVLAEYPHLAALYADEGRLQVECLAPIETYRNPARPAIFVGAHLSNWEVMGLAIARLGIPVAGLYSPPTNPLLDEMLRESRRVLNCKLLPRDNSSRHLLRTLREHRSIGLVIDRRVDDGQPIPFFGRDKLSTLVPARLALKCQCELVPIRVEPLGDARYRVRFYPPVKPPAGLGEMERARDMTRQVHQLFEAWVRAQPEDWFCSKRLWAKSTLDASAKAADGTSAADHET